MSNYIRTLVSGNKARYKDEDLDLDLDLAYITDNVIVMGYPAAGIEGLYRNRREDAKKFLQHRHGNNYWIFNFCPIRENSYPSSFFDDRVSRYPFPDHHAPPLAVLPLIAREMGTWLSGSPHRVAVLHCKAGKGRSGTMACAYLLTLEKSLSSQKAQPSLEVKAQAEELANEVMDVMPTDEDQNRGEKARQTDNTPPASATGLAPPVLDKPAVSSPRAMSLASDTSSHFTSAPDPSSGRRSPAQSTHPEALKSVLELHTSKRMKIDDPQKKVKQGVSIPSQRRWLLYWSLLLAGAGPRGFWGLPGSPFVTTSLTTHPKARILSVTVRMREQRGVTASLVKAINVLADQTSFRNRNAPQMKRRDEGEVWISLARYDDSFVETLEGWERHTRDEDKSLGVRKAGTEHMEGSSFADLFKSGRYDQDKMVRSFARLGAIESDAVGREEDTERGKTILHRLTPLSNSKWSVIREKMEGDGTDAAGDNSIKSETASINDDTEPPRKEGVVVDAHREMRGKLYMGQVFFGWFWFIPAFHLPEAVNRQTGPTHFTLGRKEVDFPLGVGEALVDVDVEMEWCDDPEEQPAKQSSEGSADAGTGILAQLASG